ncbi:MAG: hypothetical protein JWR49_1758 [Tardiphaga sp.]|nr:hypothetical protein [Tardiphaga sp.]
MTKDRSPFITVVCADSASQASVSLEEMSCSRREGARAGKVEFTYGVLIPIVAPYPSSGEAGGSLDIAPGAVTERNFE